MFGGDSWAREAQYRKRRVDDLILDALPVPNDNNASSSSSSSYKKLPSGKFACLVCPHNPVLDSPLMLSMHIKGSRHSSAEAVLKERELERQHEMNKRIALSQISSPVANAATQQSRLAGKPLIERTRKAASEVLCTNTPKQTSSFEVNDVKPSWGHTTNGPCDSKTRGSFVVEAVGKDSAQQQLDYQERRERELKFTAAGWKRDGHGGWFRDENVEFDSDEEDPNVSLA